MSSLRWAVATITTVGYGDIYPVTPVGRFLRGVIAVIGMGIVALPTGIISSGFIEEINKTGQQESTPGFNYCPYCGKKLRE